jgi:hypothetical protein
MTRVLGLLLFLPVPLVLWLYTRAPLGVGSSLALGVALMLTHRLYARPFALRHAAARCLWCGRAAGDGPTLAVDEPLGRTTWRACGTPHGDRVARLLARAHALARPLKLGILGTLAAFLVAAPLAHAGKLGALEYHDLVAFFRIGIASSVLGLAAGSGSVATATGPLRAPFPVHIQALIGSAAVLWLFRLVGVAWFVLGSLHVARRFGLA